MSARTLIVNDPLLNKRHLRCCSQESVRVDFNVFLHTTKEVTAVPDRQNECLTKDAVVLRDRPGHTYRLHSPTSRPLHHAQLRNAMRTPIQVNSDRGVNAANCEQ